MDRIIEKQSKLTKRTLAYIGLGIAVVGLVVLFLGTDYSGTSRVESDRLTVDVVQHGVFNDYVRLMGQVQPITTIQLSAIEGGMVQSRQVEEGAMVKQGDAILHLSNPMLNLNILESEAQLAEKSNFLRNTLVQMEQERLTLKREKLQLDLDIERKHRKYQQLSKLYGEQFASKEEYLQAKEDYEYAVKNRELVVERQRQDSAFRGVQVHQMEESLSNMRRNLALIRQRMDNLVVRAPLTGQLGLLEAEVGQSIATGQKIGQVNVLTDFKIEAKVDEHYIDRVKSDLQASLESQGKTYRLRVRKVFPEVRSGQFRVELVFVGARPENLRTGQSYQLDVQLGQPAEATLIPRGGFYDLTGGQWIFVVDPNGAEATRRSIRIGRQNAQFYEVLDGLRPGERVITSGYDLFGTSRRLLIKK
ncbi:HlyD family efflux transporter periplasmic adaptor subunit [uncultured Acetobacteroides sp.]|uniref:efflux RND transporter periplasmic adaptor subunit n=1 Tax=uncultured Acetobacteroides sp. TaxID=1760811 RepID=UPI0029F50F6A|nr:HlyD family efflux transporter periplasmic adaptor subunit [uncultured Acetobacteroides sp.]